MCSPWWRELFPFFNTNDPDMELKTGNYLSLNPLHFANHPVSLRSTWISDVGREGDFNRGRGRNRTLRRRWWPRNVLHMIGLHASLALGRLSVGTGRLALAGIRAVAVQVGQEACCIGWHVLIYQVLHSLYHFLPTYWGESDYSWIAVKCRLKEMYLVYFWMSPRILPQSWRVISKELCYYKYCKIYFFCQK